MHRDRVPAHRRLGQGGGVQALASALLMLAVSACSTVGKAPASDAPRPGATSKSGGYYMDDGPGDLIPPNLDKVPDAVPKAEPIRAASARPYNVFGVDYQPHTDLNTPYLKRGIGSWYGRKFHGQKTSSGEIYDMFGMTAAHPILPIPSYARVTNLSNGKSVIVRINDRGPFLHNRIIDLSYTAAYKLGYVGKGSSELEVEKLTPTLIAAYQKGALPPPMTSPPTEEPVAQSFPIQADAIGGFAQLPPASGVAATAAPGSASAVTTAAVVPPPASAATPTVMPGAQFFVQLGAFSSRDNAERLLKRVLGEADFAAAQAQIQNIGGTVFKVVVGPFTEKNDAQAMSNRLQSVLASPSIVTGR